ncbi:MAG: glycosyltransferase [Chloroflexi bacterium]|nr:glycosyltransferase [Chloroflexota bacterium]MBI3339595.1 glycosyltransferase [Chloroflexota bacterium]
MASSLDDRGDLEITIVLPCLNEERTVGVCVDKAISFLRRYAIKGEVLVADNGSTDRSVDVAVGRGARVVRVSDKGYGNALRGGFTGSLGKFIIMADADDSYDLENLFPFVEKLRDGYDLVMGNRFKGGIRKGAMPWHHRYIGNPVLSFLGRLFFNSPASDFHCGLRGFTKKAIEQMDLQTTGMELASEIIIKASIFGMKVCEVPTVLFPDGRGARPHLRSFRDGWRHLRFLLLYSPRWLFFYPGLFFLIVGGLASLALFFGPVDIGLRPLDFHSFILAGAATMLGLSTLSFAAITRVFAYNFGYLPTRPSFFFLFKYFNLEIGIGIGLLMALLGAIIIVRAALLSASPGFAVIGFGNSIRLVFGGSLSVLAGGQIVLTSFVLSILGLRERK